VPRGGYRPGAGRPKGSKNRRTLLLEEGARVAAEAGTTPLEHLLSAMRDENQPTQVRLDAAKAAAPYCHPRLTANHNSADDERMSHEDWMRMIAGVVKPN